MRPARPVLAAVLLVLAAASGGCGPDDVRASGQPSGPPAGSPSTVLAQPHAVAAAHWSRPLAGRVVVLDPGHQLGNRHFPRQTSRLVPAGGFTKPCNTTGTQTRAGYPEATFTWRVATDVRRRLVRLGARVLMTRHSNSERRWGPCVDVRGRAGNHAHADLKLSIHGDGSDAAGAHGFHVIAPADRRPWTHDIYASSRAFALALRRSLHRSGLPYATYVAGGDGLDVRADLATLNLSDVPTAMVELGNLRDAGDARRMTSRRGQERDAVALVTAVRRCLRADLHCDG